MVKLCPIMTGDNPEAGVWLCHEGLPSMHDKTGSHYCMAWLPKTTIDLSTIMGEPMLAQVIKQIFSAMPGFGTIDETGIATIVPHCVLLESKK